MPALVLMWHNACRGRRSEVDEQLRSFMAMKHSLVFLIGQQGGWTSTQPYLAADWRWIDEGFLLCRAREPVQGGSSTWSYDFCVDDGSIDQWPYIIIYTSACCVSSLLKNSQTFESKTFGCVKQ